jgi:hypothetical protein
MGWGRRNIWRPNKNTDTDCVFWEVRDVVEGKFDNIKITLEHDRILNLLSGIESNKVLLEYEGNYTDNNRAKAPVGYVLRTVLLSVLYHLLIYLFIYFIYVQ